MNIKLQAPAGLSSVNWNGECYQVVNGIVEVPKAAFDELTRPIHGFTRYVDGPRGADAVAALAGQSVEPPREPLSIPQPRNVPSGRPFKAPKAA